MRQKRASVEIEAGRRLLEEKLRIYTQAGVQGRRNLALEMLTGGAAEDHLLSAGLGAVAAAPLYAFAPAGAMTAHVRGDDTGLHVAGEREPRIVIRTTQGNTARRVERRRTNSSTAGQDRAMPRAVPFALLAIMLVSGALTVRSLLEGGAHASASEAPVVDATSVGTTTPSVGSAPPARAVTAEPIAAPTAAMVPPTAVVLPPALASPVPADGFRTLLDERFADTKRGWPDNPRATAWLAEGSYHLFARDPGRFVAIGAPIPDALGDVDVTATFRKTGGPPGGGYGLVLRDQGPGRQDGVALSGRFYVFEVGDRGELGIWLREEDHWVDLLPWTPSEAVHPGTAQNQVRVTATGERMSFVVNGVLVASKPDTILRQGTPGVFVGGDLNEVTLERFTIQVPA